MLEIKQSAIEFLNSLPEKDRRIIGDHISRLEERWPPNGDFERLYNCRYRLHVSRKYTIFLEHDGNNTTILKIMTLEQAHKKYGKI